MRSCEIPCLNGWMNQTSTSARGIIPGRCGTRIRKGWEAADRPGRILVQAPCLAARAPNTGGRQEKRSNSSRNCRRGLWLLPGSGRGRPGSLGAMRAEKTLHSVPKFIFALRAYSESGSHCSQNPLTGIGAWCSSSRSVDKKRQRFRENTAKMSHKSRKSPRTCAAPAVSASACAVRFNT